MDYERLLHVFKLPTLIDCRYYDITLTCVLYTRWSTIWRSFQLIHFTQDSSFSHLLKILQVYLSFVNHLHVLTPFYMHLYHAAVMHGMCYQLVLTPTHCLNLLTYNCLFMHCILRNIFILAASYLYIYKKTFLHTQVWYIILHDRSLIIHV